MENVMFQVQEKTTRSGVYVGGRLLTKEDLFYEDYIRKVAFSRNFIIEFAEPRCYFKDLKSMTVEQFEKYFTEDDVKRMQHLLTYDSSKYISGNVFSKEVLLKWGTNTCPKEKLSAKKLRKLEAGHIYKAERGDITWLYLGNISVEQYVNGKCCEPVSGNCFISVGCNSDEKIMYDIKYFFRNLATTGGKRRDSYVRQHFIKGVKAVTEDTGISVDIKTVFDSVSDIVIPKGYYDAERKIKTVINEVCNG